MWTGIMWLRIGSNAGSYEQGSKKAQNLLTSCPIISFSGTTMLHELVREGGRCKNAISGPHR
jgi:hypothetical protein